MWICWVFVVHLQCGNVMLCRRGSWVAQLRRRSEEEQPRTQRTVPLCQGLCLESVCNYTLEYLDKDTVVKYEVCKYR